MPKEFCRNDSPFFHQKLFPLIFHPVYQIVTRKIPKKQQGNNCPAAFSL